VPRPEEPILRPATSAAGFVPLCVPELGGNEWRYVKECLDTNWVSSVGSYVDRLERALADATGAKYAVATVNGTAALHVALLVAGVQPGDEVLVSTLTFIAPVNAIRYVGARPVFIDAEAQYWQMDPERVADFLRQDCIRRDDGLWNRHTGRRVRAVLPVHILGHPVDLDAIREIARRHGLTVIEDACESLGASCRGAKVGHLGDVACFSFNGNKLVTTGGGGMLVTDHEGWARRARYLTTQAKDDPVEFVHREVGYNYRLTNLQAAVGVAQLEQLEARLAAKRRIATLYQRGLGALPGLTPMPEAPWATSAFWMYTILVEADRFGMGSRELHRVLSEESIETRPLWQPIHRSPAHGSEPMPDCPVADRLNRDALSLPCSVGLEPAAQQRVIDAICRAQGGRIERRRATATVKESRGV
jgi:perosamine synthetase